MSKWPQGCGMYHAAVRSGAGDLVGLTVGRLPATVQVIAGAGPVEFHKGPRLAEGAGGAGLETDLRLLRRLIEDRMVARVSHAAARDHDAAYDGIMDIQGRRVELAIVEHVGRRRREVRIG